MRLVDVRWNATRCWNARVGTSQLELQIDGREAGGGTKGSEVRVGQHVALREIGLPHDGDGDACAGEVAGGRRIVIDGVQVARRDVVAGDAAYRRSEAGLHRIRRDIARAGARLQLEVVEAGDGKRNVSDGRRQGGIGEISDVRLAMERYVVNGGAERLLHLSDCAAESDEGGTLRHAGDGEALAGEPGGDRR